MLRRTTTKREAIIQNGIIILSIIGLMVCIALLFPQVRQLIVDLVAQVRHREIDTFQEWLRPLLSFAMGGICLIVFIDYCTLTNSGRVYVRTIKQEITDCLSAIDFRSLRKPTLLMFGIYCLGILTIIRANFSYCDDLTRVETGVRGWHNWSRYVSDFLSVFIHGNTNLTDISPLPQLLAILILSVSSVQLVYVLGNRKITVVRLLASIPLGLSPYFLECLSYKFDSPYMALSILASIFPFLFVNYKKAFVFVSIISLLIMCMTYQTASGIYLIIAVMFCFQNWNNRQKTNKEIFSIAKTAIVAFGLAMIIFKFFLMKTETHDYVSSDMLPFPELIYGIAINIKRYLYHINNDFSVIWKTCIVIVLIFFVIKSIFVSTRKKMIAWLVSLVVICLSFVLSYGMYSVLQKSLYTPRALFGFGVWLAILCIYVVSNYKKMAIIAVFALNWCFLVFAFSYGNALADQARYSNFRVTLLLNDISTLYLEPKVEDMSIQLKNSIGYAPSIRHMAQRYPVIERLVPNYLDEQLAFNFDYIVSFNYGANGITKQPKLRLNRDYTSGLLSSSYEDDYDTYNLPIVLDSYYHTIKSDGKHILVILKH
jgi:hypothetical protein